MVLKEWSMIHKIKSLYDDGKGLSKKAIARQLKISVNTVRKYLAMDERLISNYLDDTERHKQLDDYREYIVHLLETFPQLSAVKIERKLRAKYPELAVSSRTVRRYVQTLKQTVVGKQARYYQPVLDHVPGEQCQVDPGELRGVMINGIETTIHFVVFVLSYSRLMYVALSDKAIDTECFIRMHDAAFRYFGGVTAECVYDQTKLVVIHEVYRELTLNARFHEYATHAGFRIQACEGYDPESKGKVEAGVKYVKGNALYGEVFESWTDLESYLADWLDNTANVRTHATTGQVPQHHYDQCERSQMKPYLSPVMVQPEGQGMTRKADKTGLISYRANKYSVPMAYQRHSVRVEEVNHQLHIFDLESHERIACHPLSSGRGDILKNTDHYRDKQQRIEQLEQQLSDLIGEAFAVQVSQCLKESLPKHHKDQLTGVISLFKQMPPSPELLEKLCQRPGLTATRVRDFLQAYQAAPQRLKEARDEQAKPVSTGQLAAYGALFDKENEHVRH
jgi:transposase